jgi:hypothetical protein
MTLEERRDLVIKDIVDDEENFAPGTISNTCLEFFKWVQTNTDVFDSTMVSEMLYDALNTKPYNEDVLKVDEETIKDFVKGFLNNETHEEFYTRATKFQTEAMCAADCGCAGGQKAVECGFEPNCGVCCDLNV